MIKQERTLLLVEDDINLLASWQRDIDEFNNDDSSGITFGSLTARSRTEAFALLGTRLIECAIVDLRLPDGDENGATTEAGVGNSILGKLISEFSIPTVVSSGYLEEADEDVTPAPMLRLRKKKGSSQEALRWLASQADLMTALSRTRERIRKETAGLFYKSIWPRWNSEWGRMSPETLTGIITRQVTSHVAEQLSILESGGEHHPAEYYLVPPLRTNRLHTGDLIAIENSAHVVLTPQCNIVRTYPENIILARCEPMTEKWQELRRTLSGGSNEKKASARRRLRDYATQGHDISTHFLPPLGSSGPWLVDFRLISTRPSSDSEELLAGRIASIAPQFIPNLVQRYAAYLGRVGQPDLNQDTLVELCLKP